MQIYENIDGHTIYIPDEDYARYNEQMTAPLSRSDIILHTHLILDEIKDKNISDQELSNYVLESIWEEATDYTLIPVAIILNYNE